MFVIAGKCLLQPALMRKRRALEHFAEIPTGEDFTTKQIGLN